MYSITKNQFNTMLKRIYTPKPEDSISMVRKYTYEAERAVMCQFIYDAKLHSSYDIDTTTDEPLYVAVTGHQDLYHLFEKIHQLDVYALVLINPANMAYSAMDLDRYDEMRVWSFTEFHLYDNRPDERYRMDVEGEPFHSPRLRRIGLYGKGINEWTSRYIEDYNLDVISMDTLGLDLKKSIEINVSRPTRILDIDVRLTNATITYSGVNILDNMEFMSIGPSSVPWGNGLPTNVHTIVGNLDIPEVIDLDQIPIFPFQLGGDDGLMYPNVLELYLLINGDKDSMRCLAPLHKYPNLDISMIRYSRV